MMTVSLLHGDADVAFVVLNTKHKLLSHLCLDGITQNHGSLFPVGGLSWGVQPHLVIQAQMKPKWNRGHSPRPVHTDL